jgi:putative zinc finger/helix-turn-helix YgiT family protein
LARSERAGRKNKMTKCPTCGAVRLVADECDERVEVAGVTFMARVPCSRCKACGGTLLSDRTLERFELTVAVELARIGRRTGSALRYMRKALGFGSAEIATLLGVAPETFSRWETGTRAPDAGAFALVGALAADRLVGHEATAERLRGIASPRALPKRPVRLRVDAA